MSCLRACFCPCFGDHAAAALPEEARGGRDPHSGHRWRRSGRFLSRLMRRGRRNGRDRDQEYAHQQDFVINKIDHHSSLEHSTQDVFYEVEEEESSQQISFTVQEADPRLALACTNRTGTVQPKVVPVMFLCVFFLLCIFATMHQQVIVQDNSLIFRSTRSDEFCSSRVQVAIAPSWVYTHWCIVALIFIGFAFVVYLILDRLCGVFLIILYIMHRFEHTEELRLPTWIRWFIS